MKKLMIAAAIVCAAALSQAATFQWMSDVVYMPSKISDIAEGTGLAPGTKNSNKLESWATASPAATFLATIAISDDGGTTWSTTDNVAVNTDSGSIMTMTSNDAFSRPTTEGVTKTLQWKIVINGSYTDGSGQEWVITSNEITGSKGYQMGDTDQLVSAVPTSWDIAKAAGPGPGPVPEPTSGLLLLLGVAGLALKRKRA